jgi:hypothetical protein
MFRRVVPSPQPQSILQIEQIKALLSAQDGMVICCGGGGVVRFPDCCFPLLPASCCLPPQRVPCRVTARRRLRMDSPWCRTPLAN